MSAVRASAAYPSRAAACPLHAARCQHPSVCGGSMVLECVLVGGRARGARQSRSLVDIRFRLDLHGGSHGLAIACGKMPRLIARRAMICRGDGISHRHPTPFCGREQAIDSAHVSRNATRRRATRLRAAEGREAPARISATNDFEQWRERQQQSGRRKGLAATRRVQNRGMCRLGRDLPRQPRERTPRSPCLGHHLRTSGLTLHERPPPSR
jgi:hypothetical protein